MRALQHWAGVTLVGALVALAGGCGSEEEETSQPGDAELLRDRTFLLQSSEGFEPVAGTTIRVYFKGNEAGFNGGCNSYFGTYQVTGGVLSFSGLGSTLIGCDAPLQQQDEWLATFIGSGPRLTLSGNDLTLRSPTATLVFLDRVVADPDRPLVGTPWTVNGYFTGGIATSGPMSPKAKLVFGADGRVDVETTCNTGTGTFAYDGAKLTLAGMTYSANACADALVSTADQHLRSVLADGQLTVKIMAAQLTLTRGELGVFAGGP